MHTVLYRSILCFITPVNFEPLTFLTCTLSILSCIIPSLSSSRLLSVASCNFPIILSFPLFWSLPFLLQTIFFQMFINLFSIANTVPVFIVNISVYWYSRPKMFIRWGDTYSTKCQTGRDIVPMSFNVYMNNLSLSLTLNSRYRRFILR